MKEYWKYEGFLLGYYRLTKIRYVMSAFTDNMIDNGFNDPEDYLDHLLNEYEIMQVDNYDDLAYEALASEPMYIRRLYETRCPNCDNRIRILPWNMVRCYGYPTCHFGHIINDSEHYLGPIGMKSDPLKYWRKLNEEITHLYHCPDCNNYLTNIELNGNTYRRCSGFPICLFSIELETKIIIKL